MVARAEAGRHRWERTGSYFGPAANPSYPIGPTRGFAVHIVVEGVSLGRQVLRRHVNEQLSASASPSVQTLELFCECGGRSCSDRIVVGTEEYAELRAVVGRYLVTAAHGRAEAAEGTGYAVVDGLGAR